jgi:hypothetical protein
MLGEIRRLHAAASDSYRGQQLAQLLQQAFNSSSTEAEDEQQQQQQQQGFQTAASGAGGLGTRQRSSSRGLGGGWRPPFQDIG